MSAGPAPRSPPPRPPHPALTASRSGREAAARPGSRRCSVAAGLPVCRRTQHRYRAAAGSSAPSSNSNASSIAPLPAEPGAGNPLWRRGGARPLPARCRPPAGRDRKVSRAASTARHVPLLAGAAPRRQGSGGRAGRAGGGRVPLGADRSVRPAPGVRTHPVCSPAAGTTSGPGPVQPRLSLPQRMLCPRLAASYNPSHLFQSLYLFRSIFRAVSWFTELL